MNIQINVLWFQVFIAFYVRNFKLDLVLLRKQSYLIAIGFPYLGREFMFCTKNTRKNLKW